MWVGRRVSVAVVGSLMATMLVAVSGTTPATAVGSGDGLRAYYFNDARSIGDIQSSGFAGVFNIRTDAQSPQPTCKVPETVTTVNFNWGVASPGSSCSADNFGAYYTGYLLSPHTGTITFQVTIDDAAQLKLDGTQVVASLRDNGGTPYTGTFTTTAGKIHKLDLWFRDLVGSAQVKLEWKYGSMTSFQLVPQSNLATAVSVFQNNYVAQCTTGIGLSADCPAFSLKEILDLYESTTATTSRVVNGVTSSTAGNKYWLQIAGAATEVAVQWDKNFDGGGYILLMKGTGNGAFKYDHPAWTNPNWIGRANNPRRISAGNEDAKYAPFNYTRISSMMAVFPQWNTGTKINGKSMPVGHVTTWNEFNWKDTGALAAMSESRTAVGVFGNTGSFAGANAGLSYKIGSANETVTARTDSSYWTGSDKKQIRPRYFGQYNNHVGITPTGTRAVDWYGINLAYDKLYPSARDFNGRLCEGNARWGGLFGTDVCSVPNGGPNIRGTYEGNIGTNITMPFGIGTRDRAVMANGEVQGSAWWTAIFAWESVPPMLFPQSYERNTGFFNKGRFDPSTGPSWEVWGKPDAGTALTAPTGVKATAVGGKDVKVEWTSVTGANEYVIQYKETSTATWNNAATHRVLAATSSTTSAVIQGLGGPKTYTFRVSARKTTSPVDLQTSAPSAETTPVEISLTFGATATDVKINPGETVTLSVALGDANPETVTSNDPLAAQNFGSDVTSVTAVLEAGVGTLSLDTATIPSAVLTVPTAPSGYPAFSGGKVSGSSIAFTGNVTHVNQALALVKYFRPANALASTDVTIKISDAGTASIRYNPENGHYYQLLETSTAVKWYTARCLAQYISGFTLEGQTAGNTGYCAEGSGAQKRRYQGMDGYLLTITSQEEQDFIQTTWPASHVPGNSADIVRWIGASDDVIQTSSGNSLSNSGAGKWIWADGPERGIQFAQETNPKYLKYGYWLGAATSVTPDNANAGESVLGIVSQSDDTSWLNRWNDVNGNDAFTQLFVEYSTPTGVPNSKLTLSKTLTITQEPSMASVANVPGSDTATISAVIKSAGSTATPVLFYGTDSASVTAKSSSSLAFTPKTVIGETGTSVSATLTGLKPASTYYYLISTTNGVGETSTAVASFTTSAGTPVIAAAGASKVDSTSATVNLQVTPNSASATPVIVRFGTDSSTVASGAATDTRTATPETVTGTSASQVSASLTGLAAGTTYYFRPEVGGVAGAVASFTTPAAPAPTLTAAASTPVSVTPPGSNTAVSYSVQVAASHGKTMYVDFNSNPAMDATYIAYRVTNPGATELKNIWVSLSNFSGGVVGLVNPSDAYQMIPSIPAGATRTVYFLVSAARASTTPQAHDIRVTAGDPRLQGAVELTKMSYAFDNVAQTGVSASNDVTSVTYNTLSPLLGGTMTITVKGNAGPIGAGDTNGDGSIMWLSPTGYSSWPSGALKLESVSTDIGVVSGAGGCSTQYTNQLVLTNAATCHSNQNYTTTYTFRSIAPTVNPFTVAPVVQAATASGYGHTDFAGSSSAVLAVVPQQTMAVQTDSMTATGETRTVGGVAAVVYNTQMQVTSTSSLSSQMQQIEVTLSAGTKIDTTTATLSGPGVAAGTPVAVSQSATDPNTWVFTGPFPVNGSTPSTITYQATVPTASASATVSVNGTTGGQSVGNGPTTESQVSISNNGGSPASSTTSSSSVAAPATASAAPATAVTSTSATFSSLIYNTDTQTALQFQYSTSPNMYGATLISASPETSTGQSQMVATAAPTNLLPNTTYYFQPVVGGVASGPVMSAATTDPFKPSMQLGSSNYPTLNVGTSETVTIAPTIQSTVTGPVEWSISNGSLPSGMQLDTSTGVVSGVPTVPANYNFTLQVQTTGTSAANTVTAYQPVNMLILGETATVGVSARPASMVLSKSAVLNGDVDYLPFGTDIFITYWNNTEPSDTTTVAELSAAKKTVRVGTSTATAGQRVSWTLLGLETGTAYAYRVVAGGIESNMVMFTTETQTVAPPVVQVVLPETVTVTTTSATLAATGNNLAGGDTLKFLVSTSASLASPREIAVGPAAGSSAEDITYELVDLQPSTTYYYQLVGGPVSSTVRSFTTAAPENNNSNNNSGGGSGGGASATTTTTGGNDPKVEEEIKNNVKFGDPTAGGANSSAGGAAGGGSTAPGSGTGTGTGSGTGTSTGSSATSGAANAAGTANVSPRPGTPLFIPISGLPSGSIVALPSASTPPTGLNGVFLTGASLQIIPSATFSGKTSVPVQVTVGSTSVTLKVPVAVNPATVTEIQTRKNAANKTLISWDPVANAVRYQVSVAGTVLCTTANNACLYNGILGPKSQITVVSLGNDGTASQGASAGANFVQAIRVGTIKFNTNASSLDKLDRKVLAQLAKNMKVWGFQTVYVVGYTDGRGGSKGSIALSRARAESVLKVLKANLSAKFKLKAMGEKNPIASNKTPEGQAKNRRVEVLVR